MLVNDSDGCFGEHRYYNKSSRATISLFVVEIMECLLHRFSKLLSEPSWIQAEELLVEAIHCELVIHPSWSLANIRGFTVEMARLRLDGAGVYLRHLRFSRLAFPKQDSLPDTHHHAECRCGSLATWQQVHKQ